VLDLNGDGYIDLKEFVHGFFKIYYSNLDAKLKLAFDMWGISSKLLGMTLIKMAMLKKRTLGLCSLTFQSKRLYKEQFKQRGDSQVMVVESKRYTVLF